MKFISIYTKPLIGKEFLPLIISFSIEIINNIIIFNANVDIYIYFTCLNLLLKYNVSLLFQIGSINRIICFYLLNYI